METTPHRRQSWNGTWVPIAVHVVTLGILGYMCLAATIWVPMHPRSSGILVVTIRQVTKGFREKVKFRKKFQVPLTVEKLAVFLVFEGPMARTTWT